MVKYWLWLSGRKGTSPAEICRVANYFPSAEAAYFADEQAYRQVSGIASAEPFLDKDLSEAERILSQCAKQNIRIVTMQDAAYPKRLLTIEDAPTVLYCKGILPDFDRPSVAVIGTRKASVYGLAQAKQFAYGLASCGCTVVSGGALGVDTQALIGGLLGGGPVIAVLGCGLDVDYPKSNRKLFEDVAANGCLISEFAPGTPPYASNFPQRNRIISALSLGVLVTEAPARSGALITADLALEQGRDVFVLPANVGVDTYSGNLRLLRDGAIPACEPWDILQEYAPLYPCLVHRQITDVRQPVQQEVEKKVIDKPKAKAYIDLKDVSSILDEPQQKLVQLLQAGPVHVDALVEQTSMAAGNVLSMLTVLEVKGIVSRPSPRVYELAEK